MNEVKILRRKSTGLEVYNTHAVDKLLETVIGDRVVVRPDLVTGTETALPDGVIVSGDTLLTADANMFAAVSGALTFTEAPGASASMEIRVNGNRYPAVFTGRSADGAMTFRTDQMLLKSGEVVTLHYANMTGVSAVDVSVWKWAIEHHTNIGGGYAPPVGGIPATDLSQEVQDSLALAESALQSFTESDPVYNADKPYIALKTDIPNVSVLETNVSELAIDVGDMQTDMSGIDGRVTAIEVDYATATDVSTAVAAETTARGLADADMQVQIDALLGALVFLGTINLPTASITQAAMNDRVVELGRDPVKKGFVLVDTDLADWWYDGTNWINIGNHAIGIATAITAGVVRSGTGDLQVAFDANGVGTVQGVTPANIGAAAAAHNHNASEIDAGTLPVARGGTNRAAITGANSLRNDLGLGTATGVIFSRSGTTLTITV